MEINAYSRETIAFADSLKDLVNDLFLMGDAEAKKERWLEPLDSKESIYAIIASACNVRPIDAAGWLNGYNIPQRGQMAPLLAVIFGQNDWYKTKQNAQRAEGLFKLYDKAKESIGNKVIEPLSETDLITPPPIADLITPTPIAGSPTNLIHQNKPKSIYSQKIGTNQFFDSHGISPRKHSGKKPYDKLSPAQLKNIQDQTDNFAELLLVSRLLLPPTKKFSAEDLAALVQSQTNVIIEPEQITLYETGRKDRGTFFPLDSLLDPLLATLFNDNAALIERAKTIGYENIKSAIKANHDMGYDLQVSFLKIALPQRYYPDQLNAHHACFTNGHEEQVRMYLPIEDKIQYLSAVRAALKIGIDKAIYQAGIAEPDPNTPKVDRSNIKNYRSLLPRFDENTICAVASHRDKLLDLFESLAREQGMASLINRDFYNQLPDVRVRERGGRSL